MKKRKRTKKYSKKKILIISGIIISIIIIFLVIYFLITDKDNIHPVFSYKTKITIEAGDKVPTVNDYLYKDIEDGKVIVWDNLDIKDGKVYKAGTYYGKFNYDGEERKVTLIVKDTTAPIIEGVDNVEVLAFEEKPNLLEGIIVTDNSLEEIEVVVDGSYDLEKAGEYVLNYVAKDSSGNETKKEFKLIVKENKDVTISKSSKGYTIKNYHGITYIDNIIVVNKTYGLPNNFAPNNLVTINGYIKVVDYVRDAFNNLKSTASDLGLNIYASSGYRSYSDQNYIYNNYVKMDGQSNADTYSARAGYSEHQTGLAIDLNTVDSSFEGTSESNWLKDNCYKYGFIIRYPKGKDDITGYMYEPWHIRYVGKEIATKLYNNGDWLTFEEYYGIDSKYK